ncbi:4718_t:CDS:2 [Scutellospora calospora]|uniref:4718_t:CDS:1 n=1 Tax=Scutellospora calospora TaxID=85575 RepID=A0ACA9LB55_9GLOM|nr:4718_t:CDS:2 [Scutellospora calospora]
MRRTAFMTRLEGKRFLFHDDLGRLCASCNYCGYEVISNINILISTHIDNDILKALKENQKLTQHELTKKITEQIKSLLEIMFYTSTANSQQKISAQQIHEDLILCVAYSKIKADNIPKITTIVN